MKSTGIRQSIGLVVVLAVSALLALAGIALAAGPKNGATYSGKTAKESQPITLRVSRSGKSVTASVLSAPEYCEGGSAGTRVITKAAEISSSGSFKSVISYEFAPEKKIIAKLYISGKFKGSSVKGTARSEFLLAKQCDGSTSFSAKTK